MRPRSSEARTGETVRYESVRLLIDGRVVFLYGVMGSVGRLAPIGGLPIGDGERWWRVASRGTWRAAGGISSGRTETPPLPGAG